MFKIYVTFVLILHGDLLSYNVNNKSVVNSNQAEEENVIFLLDFIIIRRQGSIQKVFRSCLKKRLNML